MANREQKNSREKKKPKADKKGAVTAAAKPAFAEPALIRKPHKGKDWS